MNAEDTWNSVKPVRNKKKLGAITPRDIATAMFLAVPITTLLGEAIHLSTGWEMPHSMGSAAGTLIGFYLARVFRY